jgi:hypothetical protein
MVANRSAVQACPFCGSSNADFFERDEQLWSVSCPDCGAIGPEANSINSANELWKFGVIRESTEPLIEPNEPKESIS